MERLEECYTVCGTGGWESCMVIQDKLQEHGLCSCTRLEPDPAHFGDVEHENWTRWRFFYETNLKRTEALMVLGKYADRYRIRFK